MHVGRLMYLGGGGHFRPHRGCFQIFVVGTGCGLESVGHHWGSQRPLTCVQHYKTSRWQSALWLRWNTLEEKTVRRVGVIPSDCLGEMWWVLRTGNGGSPWVDPEKPGNLKTNPKAHTQSSHFDPTQDHLRLNLWSEAQVPGVYKCLQMRVENHCLHWGGRWKHGSASYLPDLWVWPYQKKGLCRCN